MVRDGVFKLTLTGKVLAQRGSPDLDGNFWTASGYPPEPDPTDPRLAGDHRLRIVTVKLGALAKLLRTPDAKFEVLSYDGSGTPLWCYPRFLSFDFPQGLWYEEVDWTAEFEADEIFFGTTKVSSVTAGQTEAEHTWQVDPQDEVGRVYKLVHTATAVGRRLLNPDGTVRAEGWEVARDRLLGGPLARLDQPAGVTVLPAVGPPPVQTPPAPTTALRPVQFRTVLPELNGLSAYSRVRSTQIDQAGGRVSITETWTVADGAQTLIGSTAGKAVEEVSADARYDAASGLFSATLEGSVQGLSEYNDDGSELRSRWANAELRFTPFFTNAAAPGVLANQLTGLDLNPKIVSSSVARNRVNGTIKFSFTLDTRPALSNPNYLTEDVDVSVSDAVPVVARIGTVGRGLGGTVKQPIGSTSDSTATVSATIRVPVGYAGGLATAPSFDALPYLLAALGRTPSVLFVTAVERSFSPRTGAWTGRVGYLFE